MAPPPVLPVPKDQRACVLRKGVRNTKFGIDRNGRKFFWTECGEGLDVLEKLPYEVNISDVKPANKSSKINKAYAELLKMDPFSGTELDTVGKSGFWAIDEDGDAYWEPNRRNRNERSQRRIDFPARQCSKWNGIFTRAAQGRVHLLTRISIEGLRRYICRDHDHVILEIDIEGTLYGLSLFDAKAGGAMIRKYSYYVWQGYKTNGKEALEAERARGVALMAAASASATAAVTRPDDGPSNPVIVDDSTDEVIALLPLPANTFETTSIDRSNINATNNDPKTTKRPASAINEADSNEEPAKKKPTSATTASSKQGSSKSASTGTKTKKPASVTASNNAINDTDVAEILAMNSASKPAGHQSSAINLAGPVSLPRKGTTTNFTRPFKSNLQQERDYVAGRTGRHLSMEEVRAKAREEVKRKLAGEAIERRLRL